MSAAATISPAKLAESKLSDLNTLASLIQAADVFEENGFDTLHQMKAFLARLAPGNIKGLVPKNHKTAHHDEALRSELLARLGPLLDLAIKTCERYALADLDSVTDKVEKLWTKHFSGYDMSHTYALSVVNDDIAGLETYLTALKA
jgi:vancomycin permeability regulator SanA